MKKSCLVKILMISTVLFAVIFYFFTGGREKKIFEYVKSYGKEYLFDEIKKEINSIPDSIEKDSTMALLNLYINDLFKSKNININEVDNVINQYKKIIADSTITSNELDSLKNFIIEKRYK